MLPGFRHRLLFELKELVETEARYKKVIKDLLFTLLLVLMPVCKVAVFYSLP